MIPSLRKWQQKFLELEVNDIIVYSSDTDFTPFDVGAYASSTTYISGGAVIRAADQVAESIKKKELRDYLLQNIIYQKLTTMKLN